MCHLSEADIIAAAGRIIREADDEALAAIIRSTNATGRLWGAVAMAEAERARRLRGEAEATQSACQFGIL